MTQNLFALVSLFVVFVLLPSADSFRDTEVKVTSDGPAILDSEITFRAVLVNSESYRGPFYFRWSKSCESSLNKII